MVGQNLIHYRIISQIGEGGMGAVYRALDSRLHRHVAIKLLLPELMVDKNKRLRFIKEAQTASSLNHPNICTIHDINEDNDQHFIVMELVEGQTLAEILEQNGSIPETELIDIAINICEALSVVHAKGISHRDIKPENIMITSNGLVKVMDFGLAKLATEYVESVAETAGNESWREEYIDSVAATNLSGLLGTVHYMSPEQAQGQDVDPRSDIFSLGIMLLELITGQKPFKGDSNLDILTRIISEPLELHLESGVVSPPLNPIISKALEKDADKRYQSIDDLLDDLRKLKAGTTPISSAGETPETALPDRKGKSRISIILLSALAVTLVVVGISMFLPDDPAKKLPAMRTSRLTSYTGQEIHPSLSPDGMTVAFSWTGPNNNNFDIYIKKIKGGNPVRLTQSANPDFRPVWSPDGSRIAFLRKMVNVSDDFLTLIIMSSNGGNEREIRKVQPTDSGWPSICWSMDNKYIYYTEWSNEDNGFAINKIDIVTLLTEQITSNPQDSWGDLDPFILPDGKHLLFRRGQPGRFDLYTMNLQTKSVKKLTQLNTYIYGFCWNNETQSVLFSANLDGSIALWKTDLSGNKPKKVLSEISILNPQVSGKNNQLIYTHKIWGQSIWKLNLRNPEKDEVFIRSSFENLDPDISPDGKKILFSSSRIGTHNIWMVDSDGSNPTQMTHFKNKIWGGSPQWSPDGEQILISFQKNSYLLRSLESDPVSQINMHEFPAWNKAGDGFYGRTQYDNKLYSFSIGGELKEHITDGPGVAPKLYGNYIYFIRDWEQREIWRIPVLGGREEPVVTGIKDMYIRAWHVVKNGIYFFHMDDTKPELCYYDFQSQQVNSIKHITGVIRHMNLAIDVDPQEEYLLYSRADPTSSDLILVDNFTY